MAKQSKSTLKNYFQTGDRPSQAQYADLIDSQVNLAETDIQTMDGALSSSRIEVAGDITASGNISASSGRISSANLTVSSLGSTQVPFIEAGSGGNFDGSGLFTFLGGTLSVPNITQVTTTNIETTGDGHITASGNISSSNKVLGLTGSFGRLETVTSGLDVVGSITASGNISASGNITADTLISNNIIFTSGSTSIKIEAPDELGNANGADLTIESGDAFGANHNGGNITLQAGKGSGAGDGGDITINAGGGIPSGSVNINALKIILELDNIPTSDPNLAGQIWRDGTDLKISLG